MSGQTLHPGINLGAAHGAANEEAEIKAFGFWVFLMSDLIIFGLLFATYVVMSQATAGGPTPEQLFDLTSVAIQTALLLASSFTYGMASLALKHRAPTGLLLGLLGVTAALGAAFLALELRDFVTIANEGGIPQRSGWLSAYWALIGLHGLHIAVGLLWITAAVVNILVQGLTEIAKARLLLLGLYWHFLDLIWIGIFTIVFLRGMV